MMLDVYNSYDVRPIYRAARLASAMTEAPLTTHAASARLPTGKTCCFGRQLCRAILSRPRPHDRSRARQPAAGDTGGVHADAERIGSSNASCRGFAGQMDAFFRDRKPDSSSCPPLAGICPPAKVRRHDRRSQPDHCAESTQRTLPWCCSARACSSGAGCRPC